MYFGPELGNPEAEIAMAIPLRGWLGKKGKIDKIYEPVGTLRCGMTPQLYYVPRQLDIHPYLLRGARVLQMKFVQWGTPEIRIVPTSTILEALCTDLGGGQCFFSCIPGGAVLINRKCCNGRDDIENRLATVEFGIQSNGSFYLSSITAISDQPEAELLRRIGVLIGVKIDEVTRGEL